MLTCRFVFAAALLFTVIGKQSLCQAVGDQSKLEPFIYKITCADFLGYHGTSSTLTGFRMQGASGIITSLHGVVKCSRITAQQRYSGEVLDLTVTSVDVMHDVALISYPNRPWPLSGGLRMQHTPPDGQPLEVWGYPWDSPTLQPSRNLSVRKQREVLEDLLGSDPDLNLWRLRGSPAVKQPVLSIEGHIEAGHSGAPVVTRQGEVVGIADGGRDSGLGGFVWAIPLDSIVWNQLRPFRPEDQKSLLDRPVKTGLLGYVIPGALEVTGSSFVADYLEVTNADLNGFPADKVWNAYRLLIGSATESDKALHPLEMDTIRRKIRFNRLVQVGALVRDLSTGLLWTRDTGRSMSFGEAQDFCRQLTIEHRGWRLPTKDELDGLRFEGVIHPVFDVKPIASRPIIWSSNAFNYQGKPGFFAMVGTAWAPRPLDDHAETLCTTAEKLP